jgi:hypothetical protein
MATLNGSATGADWGSEVQLLLLFASASHEIDSLTWEFLGVRCGVNFSKTH